MISDASFMPMVSADGACPVDIHVHPDCYPAYRSLTTERVFGEAVTVAGDGFRFQAPCPEHALILCVTNAAKDKYFLSSVPKAIDAILLLRKNAAKLDWHRIVGLARDGAFFRPLVSFFALLAALGAPMDDVPDALRSAPRGLRRIALQGVIDDYRALFPHDVPLTTYLWREWLIGAEPGVAFRNFTIRMRGLIRPSSGIPDRDPVLPGHVLLPRRSDGRGGPGPPAANPRMHSRIQE
jgi:hypothetical protein